VCGEKHVIPCVIRLFCLCVHLLRSVSQPCVQLYSSTAVGNFLLDLVHGMAGGVLCAEKLLRNLPFS
jgi:hypothetical protein